MSEARTKSLQLRIKSGGDPSEAQLAQIRQYTLADMAPDQLYSRTFVIAHNAIDRDREAFDEALLADFARTLPGKGLFVKHPNDWSNADRGAPGEGRWYAARLDRMSLDEARKLLREPDLRFPPGVQTAVLLLGDGYMVRTPGNADLLLKIDGGVVGDVSIGFHAKDYERITDEQGNELNAYRLLGPGEALEASLVWLGAQPGARAIKSASPSNEDDDVDTTQKLAAAEQKATTLQTQLDEATPSHNIVLGLRKALGDAAHLVDKPEVLADNVKAAAAYRKGLISDIVAAERHLGLCGDDDEAVKAAEAIYAGDSIERLQQLHKHYSGRTPAGSRVTPSTPVRGGGAEDITSAGKSALEQNPAFA